MRAADLFPTWPAPCCEPKDTDCCDDESCDDRESCC